MSEQDEPSAMAPRQRWCLALGNGEAQFFRPQRAPETRGFNARAAPLNPTFDSHQRQRRQALQPAFSNGRRAAHPRSSGLGLSDREYDYWVSPIAVCEFSALPSRPALQTLNDNGGVIVISSVSRSGSVMQTSSMSRNT